MDKLFDFIETDFFSLQRNAYLDNDSKDHAYIMNIIPSFVYRCIYTPQQELIFYFFPNKSKELMLFLTLHSTFQFKLLIDITATDFPQMKNRFQLTYFLLSVIYGKRIMAKTWSGETTTIPSITDVHNSASWFEREVWDMFGIQFKDHPDLRRILTDYAFEGHPMRKDFPLSGYIELRYHDNKKRILYGPIKMIQEFRSFDLLSPWTNIKEFKINELYDVYLMDSSAHQPMHLKDVTENYV